MEALHHHHLHTDLFKTQVKQMLSHSKAKTPSLDHLPPTFLEFLKERGVNELELTVPIPRYVRVKPHINISTEELAAKLKITMDEIVRVERDFWAINPEVSINHCSLY